MVESVLQQSFKNWELIIIDDGSTDESPSILTTKLQPDDRVKVHLNSKNKGANYCRNQGLKLAMAENIIFFDADDLMGKNCLEHRKTAIEEELADMYIFNMGLFKFQIGDLSENQNWIAPQNSADLVSGFLKHRIPWSIMQTVWAKDFLKAIGGFDEDFQKFQDVEIHTTALLKEAKVQTFGDLMPDVFYRIDEERKNFQPFEFYKRTVDASIRYYKKFFPKLDDQDQQNHITGTLFQPLTGLCYQKRLKKISRSEYQLLKAELIVCCEIKKHRRLLTVYQKMEGWFPFHPKGLKKAFMILLGV